MSVPPDMEQKLLDDLRRMSERIKSLADLEAKSAQVSSTIARSALLPEKLRLIRRVDELIAELERMHAQGT